jgi:hypothetical protein
VNRGESKRVLEEVGTFNTSVPTAALTNPATPTFVKTRGGGGCKTSCIADEDPGVPHTPE